MSGTPDLTTSTTVVISTKGDGGVVRGEARSYVVEAVRSLRATSLHRGLEFVVVHDATTSDATLTALVEVPDLDLVLAPFRGPDSRSARRNTGALHASGDVLVFVDERTEAASEEMIGHLVAPLQHAGTGMTGPKLVATDGTIAHAGTHIVDGRLEHPFIGSPDDPGTSPDLFGARRVDALDGSCMAVSAQTFAAVGGWSEEIPDRFGAVDLGLKVRREGLALMWTPDARLWQHRSAGHSAKPWQVAFMRRRWGTSLVPTVG